MSWFRREKIQREQKAQEQGAADAQAHQRKVIEDMKKFTSAIQSVLPEGVSIVREFPDILVSLPYPGNTWLLYQNSDPYAASDRSNALRVDVGDGIHLDLIESYKSHISNWGDKSEYYGCRIVRADIPIREALISTIVDLPIYTLLRPEMKKAMLDRLYEVAEQLGST